MTFNVLNPDNDGIGMVFFVAKCSIISVEIEDEAEKKKCQLLLLLSFVVSEKERIVNLGKLTGKLTSGAGTLAGFREDKRNKATPGLFSSICRLKSKDITNVDLFVMATAL